MKVVNNQFIVAKDQTQIQRKFKLGGLKFQLIQTQISTQKWVKPRHKFGKVEH